MGQKISRISIQRLSNGAHYNFVKTTLSRAEECELIAGRLSADIATLEAAFRREEAKLRTMRKSHLTTEIVLNDAMRDSSYSGYKGAVRGMLSLGSDNLREAAERLWSHIESRRIVTTDQRDKQTGLMTSFIEELEGKYASDIAALGLTPLVATMKEANEKVHRLSIERDTEQSTKTKGATKAARRATDDAYRSLIEKVNAISVLEGDAGCADFIDAMNAQITRYKREALTPQSKTKEEEGEDNSIMA